MDKIWVTITTNLITSRSYLYLINPIKQSKNIKNECYQIDKQKVLIFLDNPPVVKINNYFRDLTQKIWNKKKWFTDGDGCFNIYLWISLTYKLDQTIRNIQLLYYIKKKLKIIYIIKYL